MSFTCALAERLAVSDVVLGCSACDLASTRLFGESCRAIMKCDKQVAIGLICPKTRRSGRTVEFVSVLATHAARHGQQHGCVVIGYRLVHPKKAKEEQLGRWPRVGQEVPGTQENDNLGLEGERASREPHAAGEFTKIIRRGALAILDLSRSQILTDCGNGYAKDTFERGIFRSTNGELDHFHSLLEEVRQGDVMFVAMVDEALSRQLRKDGMQHRRLEALGKVVMIGHRAEIACQTLNEDVPHGQVESTAVGVVSRNLVF